MEQRPRARAHKLYDDIAAAYGSNPKHWASADGATRAVERAALPYSLKQLSEWLSRGGMALGAPPLCTALAMSCTQCLCRRMIPCVFAHTREAAARSAAACRLPFTCTGAQTSLSQNSLFSNCSHRSCQGNQSAMASGESAVTR